MRGPGEILSRLRAVRRKAEIDEELDEEVRFHLEMETEENIRRGMSAEEAKYAALRRFGGVEQRKEEWRDECAHVRECRMRRCWQGRGIGWSRGKWRILLRQGLWRTAKRRKTGYRIAE